MRGLPFPHAVRARIAVEESAVKVYGIGELLLLNQRSCAQLFAQQALADLAANRRARLGLPGLSSRTRPRFCGRCEGSAFELCRIFVQRRRRAVEVSAVAF